MHGLVYAINAFTKPKTDASISTHFQQYVLFIFIFFSACNITRTLLKIALKLYLKSTVYNKAFGMVPNIIKCWVIMRRVYNCFVFTLPLIGKVFEIYIKRNFTECFLGHKHKFPKRWCFITIV